MIKKLPKKFPTMAAMIEDVCITPEEAGMALGVSRSTVYRWMSQEQAPRTAQLALYWCTRWGQSQIDAELLNRANVYQGLAAALEREMHGLLANIGRLGQLGEFGSANDPVQQIHRRFGLDGAGTFRAVPGHDHATFSQDTPRPRFEAGKR